MLLGAHILDTPGLDLIDLFHRGGFIMWPLLICSVLAIAGILDRLYFFLSQQRYQLQGVLDKAKATLEGKVALPELAADRDPISRAASVYLENVEASTDHRRNMLQRESGHHISRAEKRVRFLGTIGAISPLIGLLGTVWGMVNAFATIEALEVVKPADVAGGIWSALLTTVFGLAIAIPAVVTTRWAEARIEALANDLNLVISNLDEWSGRVTQL